MSLRKTSLLLSLVLAMTPAWAQIGQRFPSEKRIVNDPVTGTPLTFLTTKPHGDSKIYPSHPQWTADGQWLVFRSSRVKGEAIAVHEASGEMVQVTEGGYEGMLNLSVSGGNKLYFLRKDPGAQAQIRAPLYEEKVVDLILEKAKVEETKVSKDELLKEEDLPEGYGG